MLFVCFASSLPREPVRFRTFLRLPFLQVALSDLLKAERRLP
jgi:hypothetical protein